MTYRKKQKSIKIPFFKIEATGNDFIFIDQRISGVKKIAKKIPSNSRPQLVKKICDRHKGIGSDGVVFLEHPQRRAMDLKWDFYNSDGSRAEMCGNAARAVAHFIFDCEKRKGQLQLETTAGVVVIRKTAKAQYGTTLPAVRLLGGPIVQTISGKSVLYFMVNSGVPHAVVPLKKKLAREILNEMAVDLKKSGRLGRGGANVTFFWKNGRGIEAITHERGVEGFTLSCGTGALAAAWVANYVLEIQSTAKSTVRVVLPGGELMVTFKDRPELVGPAALIAMGTLYV
ncbi:MAG: diaminopimelate epimerase [Pseudomonadota bacterium]|nr:diaminopimelate epimerase [Pseudomonadota bacterium]